MGNAFRLPVWMPERIVRTLGLIIALRILTFAMVVSASTLTFALFVGFTNTLLLCSIIKRAGAE